MIWLRFWLDIWKTRPSKLWGSALWIWSCNTNLYIIAPVHWTVFNWIITKSIYSCYNNTCVGITRVLEQSRLTNDSRLKIVRGTSVGGAFVAVPLWWEQLRCSWDEVDLVVKDGAAPKAALSQSVWNILDSSKCVLWIYWPKFPAMKCPGWHPVGVKIKSKQLQRLLQCID